MAAITVQDLSKIYGKIPAVNGISFSVREGATCALLGGNGAGKTTTLSILLGLLKPTSGAVTIFGEDMLKHRFRVLPQMNFSSPYVELPHRLTVRENLTIYGLLYDVKNLKTRIDELAQELNIGDFIDRASGKLSSGQKTRVTIAKALLNKPRLLLLDEPTASLDPDTADWMRGYLEKYRAQSGCTILLASHNMREIERLCTDVLMLKAGKIVDAGSPAALVEKYGRQNMEEVFLDIARNEGKAA